MPSGLLGTLAVVPAGCRADAAVEATRAKFHWVDVDRDHSPALPGRFWVSA